MERDDLDDAFDYRLAQFRLGSRGVIVDDVVVD